MPDFRIQVHGINKKKRETKKTILLRRAIVEWRKTHKTSLITPPTCTNDALFF
jgi:hypothetical protein